MGQWSKSLFAGCAPSGYGKPAEADNRTNRSHLKSAFTLGGKYTSLLLTIRAGFLLPVTVEIAESLCVAGCEWHTATRRVRQAHVMQAVRVLAVTMKGAPVWHTMKKACYTCSSTVCWCLKFFLYIYMFASARLRVECTVPSTLGSKTAIP